MNEAFESIKQGLNEALEHAAGKPVAAVVHRPKALDVKAIRDKVGLNQREFAASVGVTPGTVRKWERGNRAPSGPARVLLGIIAENPDVVLRAR